MKARWRTRHTHEALKSKHGRWVRGSEVKTRSLSLCALSACIKSQNSTVNGFIVLIEPIPWLDTSQQPNLPWKQRIHGVTSSSPPTPTKSMLGSRMRITAKKREHNTLLPVRSSCQCHIWRWQIDVVTPTDVTQYPVTVGEFWAVEGRVTRMQIIFAKTSAASKNN